MKQIHAAGAVSRRKRRNDMLETNEWMLRRESVPVPVQLPALTQEQSIELDYVLPDYYPDFFRLLHCSADTTVSADVPADGAVSYTLHTELHVLYCGAQTGAVQTVTQQLEYQGRMLLPAEFDPSMQLCISAEPSYLNCRAVSPRRIDLRGAVRIQAIPCGEQQKDVLSGAEGLHVHTRTEPVTYVSQILRTQKRFVLSEDIRIPDAQPAMLSVLRTQTDLSVRETRIVAGKLVIKGEAAVSLLYTAEQGIETVSAVFPFSQIAEQDGLTDDMSCAVSAVLTGSLLTPESENDGDLRLIHCDLQIMLRCEAVRTASAELMCDLYSTRHPVTLQQEAVTLLAEPADLSEHMQQRVTVTQPDAVLTKVYAAWAEPVHLQADSDAAGSGTVLSGELHCCVLAADAENHTMMLEKSEPFTWALPDCPPMQNVPDVTVQSCSYTLTGSDTAVLQPELLLRGRVLRQQTHTLLTGVQIDPETQLPASECYALRLYFAQPDESLWEIAKRYHTSEEAIREENDVPADSISAPQMLLIPIVQ